MIESAIDETSKLVSNTIQFKKLHMHNLYQYKRILDQSVRQKRMQSCPELENIKGPYIKLKMDLLMPETPVVLTGNGNVRHKMIRGKINLKLS